MVLQPSGWICNGFCQEGGYRLRTPKLKGLEPGLPKQCHAYNFTRRSSAPRTLPPHRGAGADRKQRPTDHPAKSRAPAGRLDRLRNARNPTTARLCASEPLLWQSDSLRQLGPELGPKVEGIHILIHWILYHLYHSWQMPQINNSDATLY